MHRARLPVVAFFAFLSALPLSRAEAASILLVVDSDGDLEIATALMADGHTVTVITDDFVSGRNPTLATALDGYDAVYWSADGNGGGSTHTDTDAFANLQSYIEDGGRVFVTGYDSIASPSDPLLYTLLGGTGSRDQSVGAGTIADVEGSLTVGLVDIRGVSPAASGNHDCLTGFSAATGAILIASSGSDTSCAQWSIRSLGGGEIAYVSNDGNGSEWSTVATGAAGVYNAAIRNFASAADFSASDPGSPDIVFDSPFGNDEGREVLVTVVVQDLEGDTFNYSWDLDDDAVFGETPDALDYTIAAGTTDGPDTIRVGVRAVDELGNTSTRYRTLRILNVDPRGGEPPEFASVGVDLEYAIEVIDPAGPLDTHTFTLVTGPTGMGVSVGGLVTWIPDDADVTDVDERVLVEILIEDDDGGMGLHRFELQVSPNRQPTTPEPIYPANGIGIIERQPLFAIQNSEDPDLDPLSYEFELDTSETFDSENLVVSGLLPEVPGFTSWGMAEPLLENERYYWRVRAHDTMIYSRWRQAVFFVIRDPSLPPLDAGPPDGGPMPDAGPGPDAGTGDTGGCAVRPGGRAPVAPIALLLAAGLVARSRSRSRRNGGRSQ